MTLDEIIEAIGIKPFHREPAGCIYLADCMDILPKIPEKSIDLIIADPPYIIHAGRGGGCFGNRKHLVNTGGFTDNGCNYKFLNNLSNWFCFCSIKQLLELISIAGIHRHWHLLIWCKPNPVPTCNNKYLPDLEFIVHAYSNGRLFGNMQIKSSYMVYPCGNKNTEHPNEKPIEIMNKLIMLGSQSKEIICDPFLGSGTTAVAAKRLGRKFIGIEISSTYCDLAVKRLSQEVLPL